MNNVTFTYNQESAAKAGGGDFVNDGGAYAFTIESAKYVDAGSGSKGIELSVVTDAGMKANYLSMWYQKPDGSEIKSGTSCINSIMYFNGIQNLTAQQSGSDYIAPELIGKKVGLFLQKTLYTKNNGGDGYRFDIRAPFHPKSKHTANEAMNNKPAQSIDNWTASYKDKDDRNQNQGAHTAGSAHQGGSFNAGGGFNTGHSNQFPQGDDIPGF